MSKKAIFIITIVAVLIAGYLVINVSKRPIVAPGPAPAGTVTINMTAKKFQFEPGEIRVNKGDDVVINLTSPDVAHGFAISEYGINETVNPGETKQVKFTADKAGTFSFRCSVPCGPGHPEMSGNLMVAGANSATAPGANQTTLNLKGQGLEKLPPAVLKMTNLAELDLSNNRLTGALPAEIRFLANLKKLNVSNNQMTGIPAEIGQLKELEELDYSNNQITGLPLEIKNLQKLRTLNLTGNNYSKLDLDQIKTALPNLTVVGE